MADKMTAEQRLYAACGSIVFRTYFDLDPPLKQVAIDAIRAVKDEARAEGKAEGRREALEEAAKECDIDADHICHMTGGPTISKRSRRPHEIKAAIAALIAEEPTQ